MLLSCGLGSKAFASLPHEQETDVIQQAFRRLSGVIRDSHGEPIIGATVKVKGKGATGAITDIFPICNSILSTESPRVALLIRSEASHR